MKTKTKNTLGVLTGFTTALLLGLVFIILTSCATTPNIRGCRLARTELQTLLTGTEFDNTFHHIQLVHNRDTLGPVVSHAGGHFHVMLPGFNATRHLGPNTFHAQQSEHLRTVADEILRIIRESPDVRELVKPWETEEVTP